MKTIATELLLMTESILFWLLALPFALVAFPFMALLDTTKSLFQHAPVMTTTKRLTPRAA